MIITNKKIMCAVNTEDTRITQITHGEHEGTHKDSEHKNSEENDNIHPLPPPKKKTKWNHDVTPNNQSTHQQR